MKVVVKLALLLSASVVVLGGCDQLFALLGLSVTVDGTVSGSYLQMSGPASISVSGSKSAQFQIGPSGLGFQSGNYSLTYVPKGTYTVTLTFDSTGVLLAQPQYSISGGPAIATDPPTHTQDPNTLVNTYTVTASGISVQSDMTVDIDLGNNG